MKDTPRYIRVLWVLLRLLIYLANLVMVVYAVVQLGVNGNLALMWLALGLLVVSTIVSAIDDGLDGKV